MKERDFKKFFSSIKTASSGNLPEALKVIESIENPELACGAYLVIKERLCFGQVPSDRRKLLELDLRKSIK